MERLSPVTYACGTFLYIFYPYNSNQDLGDLYYVGHEADPREPKLVQTYYNIKKRPTPMRVYRPDLAVPEGL